MNTDLKKKCISRSTTKCLHIYKLNYFTTMTKISENLILDVSHVIATNKKNGVEYFQIEVDAK